MTTIIFLKKVLRFTVKAFDWVPVIGLLPPEWFVVVVIIRSTRVV